MSEAYRDDRSAGVPPAVAVASHPRFGHVTIHDRGRLPHWVMESATYFVTFRLADSLPESILTRIAAEREAIIRTAAQLGRDLALDERKKIQNLSTPIIEHYLDAGAGACHLQNSAIASQVSNTIRYFDEKRYRLFAWCDMPNHVHAVLKIFPGNEVELARSIGYVEENPEKAYLKNWRWVWVCGRDARATAGADGGATVECGAIQEP